MLNLDDFYRARYVLSNVVRRTDLIYAPKINQESEIYLKPENLQVTGSFKLRGACYKISQLGDEEKAKGVIACSAGNHAQGVALGAAKYGIKSLICLPEGAPISKVEATRRLGADICLVPGVYDDAYRKALELRDEFGYTFIHPFDDERVIAGQGTIGLELIEQLPDVDTVIVPIGGGGLASGIAFAIKTLNPKIKVYGVQACGAPGMLQSLEHQKIECLDAVSTIADGIAVKEPGELTYRTCKQYLDGAVSVAAAMFNKVPVKGCKTVCVVSGGNIDVTILSRVINRGLSKSGRIYTFCVELDDKPGQLFVVSQIAASVGANIISVYHERNDDTSNVTACWLRVQVETRNAEHVQELQLALKNAGLKLI